MTRSSRPRGIRAALALRVGQHGPEPDPNILRVDGADRSEYLRDQAGIGRCNITKCCTEVCPEQIHITDNAIIPLKERFVDRYYDAVMKLWRMVTGKE